MTKIENREKRCSFQNSTQSTKQWTKYPEANCNSFFKNGLFFTISFKYSRPNYKYPVHTIISQSDAGIVKISKYITVNSRGIAHWTRGVKIL